MPTVRSLKPVLPLKLSTNKTLGNAVWTNQLKIETSNSGHDVSEGKQDANPTGHKVVAVIWRGFISSVPSPLDVRYWIFEKRAPRMERADLKHGGAHVLHFPLQSDWTPPGRTKVASWKFQSVNLLKYFIHSIALHLD